MHSAEGFVGIYGDLGGYIGVYGDTCACGDVGDIPGCICLYLYIHIELHRGKYQDTLGYNPLTQVFPLIISSPIMVYCKVVGDVNVRCVGVFILGAGVMYIYMSSIHIQSHMLALGTCINVRIWS